MRDRTCRACGSVFLGGPRAWYCPACRTERRREADRKCKQSRKRPDHIPIGGIIRCAICGKETVKNSGLQRYCKECAAIHLKEVDNRQSLEWKHANPEIDKKTKRDFSKRRSKEGENKKSEIAGITWDKVSRSWKVFPYISGKQVYVGRYKDLDVAKDALKKALDNN